MNTEIATVEIHPSKEDPFSAYVKVCWNFREFNITSRKRNDRIKRRFKQLQINKETVLLQHDHMSEETYIFFKYKEDAINLYFRGI